MATRHYAKNVTTIRETPDYCALRFDCACGMTGDETVAATVTLAKARARRICADHGATVSSRVSRAIH